jgi:hypothetical protein
MPVLVRPMAWRAWAVVPEKAMAGLWGRVPLLVSGVEGVWLFRWGDGLRGVLDGC